MSLTVTRINSQTEKNLPGKGDFISWKLDVNDGVIETQNAELFQKATSPAPTVGQTLDAKIEQSQYGPKIKKNQQFGGGGGGTWKPRDPAETAAIQRQHSQNVSVEVAVAAGWFNDFDPQDTAGKAKLQLLARLTDWFQRDIARGVKLAEQDGKTSQGYGQTKQPEQTGASDVPSDYPQPPSGGSDHLGGEAA